MAILSKEDAKKILEKVISFSKADGCEVNMNGSDNGNIRYARNSVSTSGEDSNINLVVQSYFGKKAGTATIRSGLRAQAAGISIEPDMGKEVTAAGYLEDAGCFAAMTNSKGLLAYNAAKDVEFSVTKRIFDGTGAGWVGRDLTDAGKSFV